MSLLRLSPTRHRIPSLPLLRRPPCLRPYTTPRPPPPPTNPRLTRLITRLPRRVQPHLIKLQSAPLSHAAAFLILHELTAVVPLLALFGVFHYTDLHVAPAAWVAEQYGDHLRDGLARFERYFRRKGWFGFDAVEETHVDGGNEGAGDVKDVVLAAQGPYRVVVEVALAYAITKALLPVRIAASLWATPWFAGVLTRARAWVGRR